MACYCFSVLASLFSYIIFFSSYFNNSWVNTLGGGGGESIWEVCGQYVVFILLYQTVHVRYVPANLFLYIIFFFTFPQFLG